MGRLHILRGISFRLLLFNILIVFAPLTAVLFLSTYEEQLLRYLEQSMVQQGRIVAAALGGRETLDAHEARSLLLRLEGRQDARLRILDPTGRIVADSSLLMEAHPVSQSSSVKSFSSETREVLQRQDASERFLYRLASYPVRLMRNYLLPPAPPIESGDYYGGAEQLLGDEVLAALEGRYGAATRISTGGQVSVTLYSALPVTSGSAITGVVLVSRSTYRILQDLYRLRLDIFRIILLSLMAAGLLSLFLSFTISRPLKRLSDKAGEVFTPGGKLMGRFHNGRRRDEIGRLALALDTLTARLREHMEFIESFASDVSHELKNPLASIRSAAEVLAESYDGGNEEASSFLAVIQREAFRMERLISAIRDISIIDARLQDENRELIDVKELILSAAEGCRLRHRGEAPRIRLLLPDSPVSLVLSPHRLVQVLENLLENAADFSPPGGTVTISLRKETSVIALRVYDDGPGIRPEKMEEIFHRFYSFRQPGKEGKHAGLGLAIVKAVVQGYGGSIKAENRPEGGACFTVYLPRS